MARLHDYYKTQVTRQLIAKLNYNSKFIALGGISDNNVKTLQMLDVYGMAGISFFKKKPAS